MGDEPCQMPYHIPLLLFRRNFSQMVSGNLRTTQIIIHKEWVGYSVIFQIYLHVGDIFRTFSALLYHMPQVYHG